jgi:hypothetical protein
MHSRTLIKYDRKILWQLFLNFKKKTIVCQQTIAAASIQTSSQSIESFLKPAAYIMGKKTKIYEKK